MGNASSIPETFLVALKNGDAETVAFTFKHKPDEAAKLKAALDTDGNPALHVAVKHGHLPCVKLLLENEFDVKLLNSKSLSALHVASFQGNLEVVKTLVDAGADVAFQQPRNAGWTAVLSASRKGHLEVLKFLLSKEAPLDVATRDGKSPLHAAAEGGHADVVAFLLEKGVATDKLDNAGNTAKGLAIKGKHTAAANLLPTGPEADSLPYALERSVAIAAVVKACQVCQQVFKALVNEETLTKKDKSPVTVADFAAQAVVNHAIMQAFPADPIVGEEDAAELRAPEGATLCKHVVNLTNSVEKEMTQDQILGAIDYGSYEGGAKGRHWALDPIDGTKGFLRGEQFAVALGLIVDGKVVLGVLGCPNLPVDASKPDGPRGCIFVGAEGQGAFMRSIDDATETPISVTDVADSTKANFCESVEAGHTSHSDAAKIADLLGVTSAPVRMDSQAKYAAVARGDASIYLRLPTRKDYEEKIWDHAAGAMVIAAAGGRVTDTTGKDLDFSIGRTLKANKGVIATNGKLHDKVVEVVKKVLGGE